MGSRAGDWSALLLSAQAVLVALVIGVSAWLLLARTSSDTEQRIFGASALLLLGGLADYLSLSALLSGVVAGTFWRLMGGQAADAIRRDSGHVQHPLLVLLLVVAGARTRVSPPILGLIVAYPILRTVGKLAGAWLARRVTKPLLPDDSRSRTCRARRLWHRLRRQRRSRRRPGLRSAPRSHRHRQHRVAAHPVPAAAGARLVRRLAALLLAVIAVLWARGLGSTTSAGLAGTALALGFTLLGALVAGDVLRRLQLPRLTGYLLFGVLVGPYLGNVITEPMAAQLQVVNGIATTLIALIAGLTLNFERLGRAARERSRG